MWSLVLESPFALKKIEKPLPKPGPGEALLRVRAVGICGSDFSAYEGKHPIVTYPRVLGHELGLEVVEVPPGEGRLAAGDRVTLEPYLGCGRCYPCREGRINCCVNLRLWGINMDGGLQEYITLPVDHLHPSRQPLSYEELALVETASIGDHAVRRVAVRPGELVFIIGAGPIGIGAMLAAKARGARVAMADFNERRLEKALSLGADYVVNTAKEDGLSWLRRLTGGEGAPVVLEAVGRPETVEATVEYASFGGRIAIMGNGKGNVVFPQNIFLRKELDFMGSRNSWGAFPELITKIEAGDLPMKSLVTHRFHFSEAIEAFKHLFAHSGEVVKAIIQV